VRDKSKKRMRNKSLISSMKKMKREEKGDEKEFLTLTSKLKTKWETWRKGAK